MSAQTLPTIEPFVGPEVVAEHLQMSVVKIRRMAAAGKIPAIAITDPDAEAKALRTGKRPRQFWRFKLSQVDRAMTPVESAPSAPRHER